MYGDAVAIDNLSFQLDKGEIAGFLGPNGTGKISTMLILSAYLPATTGTARIAGYDIRDESMAVLKSISHLPENQPLYPNITVVDFLNFVARIKGVDHGNRKKSR